MEITFLGGGNEIGASSALVEIGARRILVDCGVRMTGDNVLPDFGGLATRGLPSVDALTCWSSKALMAIACTPRARPRSSGCCNGCRVFWNVRAKC